MNWLDDYRSKLTSAAEAVSIIRSGDRVYYGGNGAIPQTLVKALAERRQDLVNVQLSHVLLVGRDPLSDPVMAGHFRHNSLFVDRPTAARWMTAARTTCPSSSTRSPGSSWKA
jgi:acyl-CoA hydrolase